MERKFLDYQSQHRPLCALLRRNVYLEHLYKAPAKILIIFACIQYRGILETVVLTTIISRGESVGHRIADAQRN